MLRKGTKALMRVVFLPCCRVTTTFGFCNEVSEEEEEEEDWRLKEGLRNLWEREKEEEIRAMDSWGRVGRQGLLPFLKLNNNNKTHHTLPLERFFPNK